MSVSARHGRVRPRRVAALARFPEREPIARRSADEIERLAAAAAVVMDVHRHLRPLLVPGITTEELDAEAARVIARAGGRSSFLGHHGFPKSICTSVNDVIIHGIPGDLVLREGDIISIDVGVVLDGMNGDAAWTYGIGAITDEARRLIAGAEAALGAAVDAARDGAMLSAIGFAVERVAATSRLGVVEDYGGHGIGEAMWEEPHVPNHGQNAAPLRLRAGMALAVEPMLTLGSPAYRTDDDGWTVRTADGSLAAHVEHDIVIVPDGHPVVLTKGLTGVI